MSINKTVASSWFFRSKSNPNTKPHEARQYVDGTTSCNCKGWCQHTDDDGNRTCVHVRMIENGTAGVNSIRREDFAKQAIPVLEQPQSEIQTPVAEPARPRLVLKWKPVIRSKESKNAKLV